MQRTCTGCRSKRSSSEMVRICISAGDGLRASDASNGRGAWICANWNCFELAKSKGRLERALRVKSLPDAQKQLSSICKVLGF